ncbi:type IX secretion system membrane protein PorP/SprF [Marivirga sp. S37H4]|uniref:Type IX secretion system membrane protein PorP/SprF n=1 Tax=Marivirga aurantiaca TaxID=2802615 RepID=A0A934X1C2_9BACT|nr:type IX secretion system membrane protein PorP/SprF [Marivirga aurantiaca]MBK6266595.1 type IX secretion system membrane protein PorP/SprF [Marivirga aurantiaca]
MKKVIYILLFLCCWGNYDIIAQQRPQYTQYMTNQLMINPAVVGSQNLEEIKIGGRIQWIGFESAPQTYFASYNTPFKKVPWENSTIRKGHHGLGAVLVKDITGPVSQTSAQANYAYHHPFTNNLNGAVGASVGIMQHTIDMNQLNFKNANDPIIDRLLTNQILPDASVGIWLYSSKFYFGASVTQIINSTSLFLPTGERQVETFDLSAHYFANFGYKFNIGNPQEKWFIVPSVLFKSVRPSSGHFDLNVMAQKSDAFWFGVSFRQDDSFSSLVGFSAGDPFSFTYSYDYIISSIGPYTGGSHELTMSFKYKRKQKKIYCPESFWH